MPTKYNNACNIKYTLKYGTYKILLCIKYKVIQKYNRTHKYNNLTDGTLNIVLYIALNTKIAVHILDNMCHTQ